MNLMNIGKLALAMNLAFRKDRYRFGVILLANLMAVAIICLPLWASEPSPDDGEKSSRKSKAVSTDTSNTKSEAASKDKTDKSQNSKSDKSAVKSPVKSADNSPPRLS